MTAITFDTLEFVETLTKTGMPEAQAKAISMLMRKSRESEEFSTKDDLLRLEANLRRDIAKLKFDLLKWVVGIALAQFGLLVGILLKLI